MKIVVALDAFKGSLSAEAACTAVGDELARAIPGVEVTVLPMADGGEGTLDALVAACHGQFLRVADVVGPLPEMRCEASFGWLEAGRVGIVEMSRASGLPLLPPYQYNPLRTTTFGTGQLLSRVLERAPARILLALGGSATVDGGTGAARALGWRFLDRSGEPVPQGGQGLLQIQIIVKPDGVSLPPVDALCDVTNPLCGPAGAATVYGPQKGATSEMVVTLDEGLANLAEQIEKYLGMDVRHIPGAGSAGGFGAGAIAFLGARLVPGVEAVAATCGLHSAVARADWVVTGEGSFDHQSLQGKVVSGVCAAARKAGTKIAVLAGRVTLCEREWREAGIDIAMQASPDLPLDQLLTQAEKHLRCAARQLARALI